MIDFEKEVIKFSGQVLVDFWAPWCGPCQMLSPILDELQDQVKLVKINVDENPEIATKYSVASLPTVIIFHQGQVKSVIVGFRSKTEYLEALQQ